MATTTEKWGWGAGIVGTLGVLALAIYGYNNWGWFGGTQKSVSCNKDCPDGKGGLAYQIRCPDCSTNCPDCVPPTPNPARTIFVNPVTPVRGGVGTDGGVGLGNRG